MTDKTPSPEETAPEVDWKAQAQDAESRNADLEDAVETLNGMVGEYQQILADTQLSLITVKAKYSKAVQRLNAASGAQ